MGDHEEQDQQPIDPEWRRRTAMLEFDRRFSVAPGPVRVKMLDGQPCEILLDPVTRRQIVLDSEAAIE